MIFPQQQEYARKLNHVLSVFLASEGKIRPHFHLTGSTGSGKSFLTKQIASESDIPFIEVNAAGLTSEGLSGNSLSKALRKLREHWNRPNIIFVDEFDKLFQRNGERTEEFRAGVQDEFLTSLESKYTSVFGEYGKYEQVVVENSLFIFAGAYSGQKIETIEGLTDAGLRPEFVGRVPLVFHLDAVPVDELKKHIQKLDLFKNYHEIFPDTDVKAAATWIAKRMQDQSRKTPIGIRLMNSTVHQYFMKDV